MKKWTTKNGVEIYGVLSGRGNSYLIHSNRKLVLVDTGKSSAFKQLKKNIDSLKLQEKNIDLLVLTHTHFDHCQNAQAIQQDYGCKIIMSEHEAYFARQGYTPIPKGTFFPARIISTIGKSIGAKRFGYKAFNPDVKIEVKTDLPDLNIQIIPTPGHSSGSISIIADNEIAIVGDTLFGVFRDSVFPPFADNVPEMVKSWETLLTFNCHTFLPGHGKEIKRALLQQEFEKLSKKNNGDRNKTIAD